jgi:hypothetical protein
MRAFSNLAQHRSRTLVAVDWAFSNVLSQISLRVKRDRIFPGDGKRRTRQLCDYIFDGLREAVPELLEATEEVRIPKWFRKSDLSERHIYIHASGWIGVWE